MRDETIFLVTTDPAEPKRTMAPSVVSYTICRQSRWEERPTLLDTSESLHARLMPSAAGLPYGGFSSSVVSYSSSHSSPQGPYQSVHRAAQVVEDCLRFRCAIPSRSCTASYCPPGNAVRSTLCNISSERIPNGEWLTWARRAYNPAPPGPRHCQSLSKRRPS